MILLKIVMVSPETQLVKNHESQSRTNESQLKKKKRTRNWKYLGLYVNRQLHCSLETDSKTLYYSTLKLKFSPSILIHNKGWKKYASLNNSRDKCHRNYTNRLDMSTNTRIQINRSIFCVLRAACDELFCAFKDFYASGMQDAELTKSLHKQRQLWLPWQVYLQRGEL